MLMIPVTPFVTIIIKLHLLCGCNPIVLGEPCEFVVPVRMCFNLFLFLLFPVIHISQILVKFLIS